eukprot:571376-Hanusia_phi.AAC.1
MHGGHEGSCRELTESIGTNRKGHRTESTYHRASLFADRTVPLQRYNSINQYTEGSYDGTAGILSVQRYLKLFLLPYFFNSYGRVSEPEERLGAVVAAVAALRNY